MEVSASWRELSAPRVEGGTLRKRVGMHLSVSAALRSNRFIAAISLSVTIPERSSLVDLPTTDRPTLSIFSGGIRGDRTIMFPSVSTVMWRSSSVSTNSSRLESVLLRDVGVLVKTFDGRNENTERKNFLNSYLPVAT